MKEGMEITQQKQNENYRIKIDDLDQNETGATVAILLSEEI